MNFQNKSHSKRMLFLLLIALPLSSFASNATWNVGPGNWNLNTNWNPANVPVVGDDIFIVDPSLFEQVTIASVSPSVNSITIGVNNNPLAADELHIGNGRALTLTGGGLVNNGKVFLDSAGANTTLSLVGAQSFSSTAVGVTGEIIMSDRLTNRIVTNNTVFTNDTTHRIQGAGQVLGNLGGLINKGQILANATTNALTIDPNGLGVTNSGVLTSSTLAGLNLSNGTFTNFDGLDNGEISAQTGAKVVIQTATIVGGDILSTATGFIDAKGSTFVGVSVDGTVQQANGQNNTVNNGIELKGSWNLNSAGTNTSLQFNGNQTITGNGDIVLSNFTTNRVVNNNTITTLGANATIRGAGQLLGNLGGMINDGTILAQGTRTLTIDANGNNFVNNNVLKAEGAGGLIINGTTVVNNSAIEQASGSALTIQGSSIIQGGQITVAAGEEATASASTFVGVGIDGIVQQANGQTNFVANDLDLSANGRWKLNSAGANTTLQFNGNQTITGNGEIVLSDATTNRVVNNNTVTTLGGAVTIRGAGQLLGNLGGMINNGTILAQGTRTLTIDANGKDFVNNNVLKAEGAGGLVINGTHVFNNSAIEQASGSALTIQGSSIIQGGQITVAAGEEATASASTFVSVGIDGTVQQANGQTNFVANDLDLSANGRWKLNSSGSNTSLQFNGNQTITGNGEIVLSDATTNRVVNNNTVTTLGGGVTIRGAGQLLGNLGGMINNGTILAQGVRTLTIDANGKNFVNNNVLKAEGAGGLIINGTTVLNNSAIEQASGSALTIQGASIIQGGQITVAAGEEATASASTFDGVSINGIVQQANGQINFVANNLDLSANGRWKLNSIAANTTLQFNGSQTITGNGEIVLSDALTNRVINNNTVTTLGANATIRGAGQILGNLGGMVNKGNIVADLSRTLTINPNGLGFENQGTVRAAGAGGITATDGYVQTAGLTQVDSIMRFTSGVGLIQGGVLGGSGQIIGDINNTGGTVNVGNSPGTLNIDGDYSQSGTGDFLVEIAGLSAGDFDVLNITGNAALGGTISADILAAIPGLSVGSTFDVLFADTITGTFDNLTLVAAFVTFDVNIFTDISSIDFVQLSVTDIAPVPLPAAFWLMFSALAMLVGKKRMAG